MTVLRTCIPEWNITHLLLCRFSMMMSYVQFRIKLESTDKDENGITKDFYKRLCLRFKRDKIIMQDNVLGLMAIV